MQTFEQILEARRVFSLQPISLPDSSASICHLLNRAREKERRDGRGDGSVMCSNFSCAPTASLFHFTMIPRVSLSPLFIHFWHQFPAKLDRAPRNRMVALTERARQISLLLSECEEKGWNQRLKSSALEHFDYFPMRVLLSRPLSHH